MNRSLRSFLKGFREPAGVVLDFFVPKEYDYTVPEEYDYIPSVPGTYVIVSEAQKFIYPYGESRVIYIGRSAKLVDRLWSHYKTVRELDQVPSHQKTEYWYYSVHQYIDAFGGSIFYYTTRVTQNNRKLEYQLIPAHYKIIS